jgi:anti-sigma regulatory factor (Ser/Thr protein kinase)
MDVARRRIEERIELAPDIASPRQARVLARELLAEQLDGRRVNDLLVLVTELVTNAVRHASSDDVVLKVLVGRSAVITEVTDEGPGFDPSLTGTPRQDRSGWGLYLVERLAHRWGVNQDGPVTKVWFELLRG